MRKYLRSKDQADNNSQIFKEAKRRFHYEPNHKEQKYFLHSKHKQPNSNNHQFKDDFSSVKELKNETNEINESSWIVKLVNVMHQNSEEDGKANPSAGAPNTFLGMHPIESKEINIIERPFVVQKKAQVASGNNEATNNMTPVATKKNSVNVDMKKKKSKSQKSQSCDTVSRKGKSSTKLQTIKRFKNEVVSSKKHSQSLPKSAQKKQAELDQKSKCTKTASCSKITSDKIKIDQNSTGSQHIHSSKHFSCNFGIDSKLNSQVNKPVVDTSKDRLKLSQDALKMECSINYQQEKEKVNNVLAEEDADNLFAISTNQKKQVQTAEKRAYVGSIKKNKPSEGSQQKQQPQKTEIPKKQQQIKIEMIDKKVKVSEEEDIVTAREQQVLIDKYLNNDYSFKKQSNLFKYDYATSEFDRSLSHLNKPAITLERPLNTAKITIRTDEKYQSNALSSGEKQLSKRQGYKKFNYFADKAQKETTQNSLSLEILTLRCNQQTSKHPETENGVYSKFNKHQTRDVDIYSSTKQLIPSKSQKEEELKRIHQKYNYQRNKQNEDLDKRRPAYEPVLEGRKYTTRQKDTKRHESNTIPTKRQNLMEIKPNIINRNPYLQQSTMKIEEIKPQTQQPRLVTSTFQYPTFKCESKVQPSESKPQFRRQSGQISSGLDNLNSISRRQCNESDLISQAESDQLITRLNSKLNNYITHYRLEKPANNVSPREFEPTHRKMNLNFNQLKKHHDLFQK